MRRKDAGFFDFFKKSPPRVSGKVIDLAEMMIPLTYDMLIFRFKKLAEIYNKPGIGGILMVKSDSPGNYVVYQGIIIQETKEQIHMDKIIASDIDSEAKSVVFSGPSIKIFN